MIYQIRSVIGGLIILLGLVHTGFAFPVGTWETDDLWFIGSGLAIVLSGLLNIIAIINCGQRWLGHLALASNIVMLGLFLLARQVLQVPQVYIGLYLYLVAILLPLVQVLRSKKRSTQYKHPPKTVSPDFKEVLDEIEVVPMLRIFDKKKAEEFYIGWLGFTVEWEHRFEENLPVYMEIIKAGIKLHLTEHHGDCNPGGKVYIVCSGLREYHKQLLEKNYSYNRPGLENASWGSLAMTVIDPFGNQLLFTEKHKSGGK
jgi:uncharacterized glyoxalase superfamily protein PhnB